MSEEARSGGLWMPYPLLAMFFTLALALGGGIIGLYSQLSAMNATMVIRDADYQYRTKKLEEKIELQGMYITDIREKLIRVEERKKGSN